MFEKLRKSLEASPIIRIGTYDYLVAPITDGIPKVDPEVLGEAIDGIMTVADLKCDFIVAPEAMGIPLAVPISQRTGIPYNVVRKKSYDLPGEVNVCQVTGYSSCKMFINGIKKGDRVVIVDDVISSGGTMKAIIKAFQRMGVEVVDVVVVLEKGGQKKAIEEELGVKIKTLVKVEIKDGRIYTSLSE